MTWLWPDHRLIPWILAGATVIVAVLTAGPFEFWLKRLFTASGADRFRRGRALLLPMMVPTFFGDMGPTFSENSETQLRDRVVLAALFSIGTCLYAIHRLKQVSRDISLSDKAD